MDTWVPPVINVSVGWAGFPPGLETNASDLIVRKGMNAYVDAYSAFMDNTKSLKTDLDKTLKDNQVTEIYVLGLATDYCVYYSVVDALSLGYKVLVVQDASRGISAEGTALALKDMEGRGATIISAAHIFNTTCPPPVVADSSSAPDGRAGLRQVLASLASCAVAALALCIVLA